MQQSNLQKTYLILHILIKLMRIVKQGFLHARLQHFKFLKIESCYIQTFQGILFSFRINFTTHFSPYTSFRPDYLGNQKANSTALFLKCKPASSLNATHEYVI